jgi:protein SCO1/2
MFFKYMRLSGSITLLLVAGLLAFSVTAAETDHENHDAHQHAADGDDDPHAHHKAMMNKPVEPAKTTEVDLLDLVLMDQNGDEKKFVSDVIGDRIVVMDFVYTSCTTVCPVISAVFGQVQNKLGDQLGDEVVLVSVSVDPIRDTPRRLKAYAATHKAKPGWIWLTGNKRTMDKVLDGLGAYSPNFEDHPAMVLVGDGQSGEWSRFFGFPSPDRLVDQVNALQAARTVAAGG